MMDEGVNVPKLSVNVEAKKIIEKMIENREMLNIKVEKTSSGATIIDAGVKVKGGLLAGKFVTEVCLGGLGEAQLTQMSFGDVELPTIFVATDHPAVSTLGSQFAGWRVKVGKYFGMGSGPARALSLKPKKLYEEIEYEDKADVAVIVLESDEKPTEEALKYIAEECNVSIENVYAVVTPTSSIAGSVQISGRVVETGIHKISEVGFDPKKILYASGYAPIAPVHPKSIKAMGRTNDMILYGGVVKLIVEHDDDEKLKEYVAKVPSCTSKDYGRPFYDIFKAAEFDFYKISPDLFAPAKIIVNNVKTGSTFVAGYVNTEVIQQSIKLQKL